MGNVIMMSVSPGPKPITAKEIAKLIKQAVKEFGSYSYEDKGPGEVMDMDAIVLRLGYMRAQEIADTLAEVLELDKKYGERFVFEVLSMMDGGGHQLDDLYQDPRISHLY